MGWSNAFFSLTYYNITIDIKYALCTTKWMYVGGYESWRSSTNKAILFAIQHIIHELIYLYELKKCNPIQVKFGYYKLFCPKILFLTILQNSVLKRQYSKPNWEDNKLHKTTSEKHFTIACEMLSIFKTEYAKPRIN